jgi:ethanolamine utilization protein EutP
MQKTIRYAMVGSVAAGKSTLFHALQGDGLVAQKTQALEFDGKGGVDTPGEFFNHPRLYSALINTVNDVDVLVYVHAATDMQYRMPPGLLSVYGGKRVLGVISQIDLDDADPDAVEAMLHEHGFVGEIFQVSSYWPETVAALKFSLMGSTDKDCLPQGAIRV